MATSKSPGKWKLFVKHGHKWHRKQSLSIWQQFLAIRRSLVFRLRCQWECSSDKKDNRLQLVGFVLRAEQNIAPASISLSLPAVRASALRQIRISTPSAAYERLIISAKCQIKQHCYCFCHKTRTFPLERAVRKTPSSLIIFWVRSTPTRESAYLRHFR